jgi:hypothetical protein
MSELSTAYVARTVGVHRDTLLRWLREGRVPQPQRDARGWRVFTDDDVRAIAAYARTTPDADLPPAARRTPPEIARLERIDWDFAEAKTQYLSHSIHPYPAKFIPQIPNTLIQELSSVGDRVADVFCGSGTTLVEAVLLRRQAVGVDANPLACLISRAKTTRLEPADEHALEEIARRAQDLAESIAPQGQGLLFEPGTFVSSAPRPSADAISFWFEPFVVEELAEALSWCRSLPTEASRTVGLNAFSSIVVNVSKQDSDTRYVRREKGLKSGDCLRRFSRAVGESARAVARFTEVADPKFSATVVEEDVLAGPDIGLVDLVVCSPPYPNAYSYHLYHMTRMVWLGMDQKTFKREEIGSHRKYSNKGAQGATVETFKAEMATMFDWLSRHLRGGRYACFVMGDSIQHGERIDNATLLSEAALGHGFVEVARIERRLRDTKKAFNPVIGQIKREEVLILQRLGGGL